MGGSYFTDRDVIGPSTDPGAFTPGTSHSKASAAAMGRTSQAASTIVLNRRLICRAGQPIICATDVTGSMESWPMVIRDKLPMLFGQIMQQNYLSDPEICFAAIGDSHTDHVPIQVCDFASGNALSGAIDSLLLEGGGGGSGEEGYELFLFYLAHCVTFEGNTRRPLVILTGDESPYDVLPAEIIEEHIGWKGIPDVLRRDHTVQEIAEAVQKTCDVFLLRKRYGSGTQDRDIEATWKKLLPPERVVLVKDPASIVDQILGIIAIMSRSRTLNTYAKDMKDRGQTDTRIAIVQESLKPLADSQALAVVGTGTLATSGGNVRKGGTRF